jgi:hypothetical protein
MSSFLFLAQDFSLLMMCASVFKVQFGVQQGGAAEEPARARDGDDADGDLFASDDEADHQVDAKVDGAAEAPANDDRRDARQAENFRKATTGLADMYDDSQGYYNFRVGELMGSR